MLEGTLEPHELNNMVSAFDQIGQIIIVRIPDVLLSKKRLIGETLLREVKTARSVFSQESAIDGEHRTRSLECISGEDNTKTQYKESGCRFMVDVENAFFSPRLSTERQRIADMVQAKETVLNMFGGIGTFSIIIAKRVDCTVYNIDINPVAADLCKKNVELNKKIAGNIISIQGDATQIIPNQMIDTSDRTLMILPERSDEFLDVAIQATKNNGIIHYYSHIHSDLKQDASRLSVEHFEKMVNVNTEILGARMVRAIGPRYYQTVVDAKILKNH